MNTSTLIRGVTGAAGNVATAMAYNDPNSPFNFFGSRAAAQDTAPAAVGNPPGGSDQRGYYNNTYGINDRYSGIPSNPWGNSAGYDYQPLDLTGDYGNYGNQSLTWGGTSNYGQFGFGGGR